MNIKKLLASCTTRIYEYLCTVWVTERPVCDVSLHYPLKNKHAECAKYSHGTQQPCQLANKL